MSIDKPYSLDFLQTIIDVHFGGLAAEIRDKSAAVMAVPLPPHKKATWSIWFRLPQVSADAAKREFQAWQDTGGSPPPLVGVVPISVMGGANSMKNVDFPLRTVGTIPAVTSYTWDSDICGWNPEGTVPQQPDEEAHWVYNDTTHALDPSYIGIDCTGDFPRLSINLVMPSSRSATLDGSWPVALETTFPAAIGQYGTTFATDDCTPPIGNHVIGDGSICDLEHHYGVLPFNDYSTSALYESDATILMGARAEFFRTIPVSNSTELQFGEHMTPLAQGGGQLVTTEKWHHLQIAMDFSSEVQAIGINDDGEGDFPLDTEGDRTTSTCRLWIIFDGVNLTRKKLSSYWPAGYLDPNAILPVNGFYIATDRTITRTTTVDDCLGNNVTSTQTQQLPTYDFQPGNFEPGLVSFSGGPVFQNSGKKIEVGEAQVFTDVIGDISANSVFLKKGSPVDPEVAQKFFRKEPEILVHGSKNWVDAVNSGSLGTDPPSPGEVLGTIVPFIPDPKLGK